MSDTADNLTDPGSPEAVVARIEKSKRALEESLEKNTFRWRVFFGFLGAGFVLSFTAAFFGLEKKGFLETAAFALLISCLLASIYVGAVFYTRFYLRLMIRYQKSLLSGSGIEKLQENLEEDFFTKLVKINFKYIDQYYLQTQSQADKSFFLTAAVATAGFAMVMVGTGMLLAGYTAPAYVASAAGTVAQFVAAVFFYFYNQTISKMAEYHRKLVMTQNISLALKIAEGLPDTERSETQKELVRRLTEDVNKHLSS